VYPYQLSKVLADERIHDMVTSAERRGRRAEARKAPTDLLASSSRASDAVAHLLVLLHVRTPAHHTSTRTSTSAAAPMGCVA